MASFLDMLPFVVSFWWYGTSFYTEWVAGNWRLLKRNKFAPLPVRRDVGSSLTGLTDAILVAMEQGTAAHRSFVVWRGGDIAWPARFPDLWACDYFLWGNPKSKA